MNTPLFTWSVVVALSMAALVIRLFVAARRCHPRCQHRRRHVIEFGSESEEFFAPGDPLKSDDHYYDDYE